jgi:hypothetical protein
MRAHYSMALSMEFLSRVDIKCIPEILRSRFGRFLGLRMSPHKGSQFCLCGAGADISSISAFRRLWYENRYRPGILLWFAA